jgi:hypothetical protein
MKYFTLLFIFLSVFVSPLSAMDIITITADPAFNFFFSFIFYVAVAPFYVVAYFLM